MLGLSHFSCSCNLWLFLGLFSFWLAIYFTRSIYYFVGGWVILNKVRYESFNSGFMHAVLEISCFFKSCILFQLSLTSVCFFIQQLYLFFRTYKKYLVCLTFGWLGWLGNSAWLVVAQFGLYLPHLVLFVLAFPQFVLTLVCSVGSHC